MARTQKDTVSYFPHDALACTGDTLTVLQSQFKNDGYAFWFKLLEKLASTEGHYIDCRNSNKWQLLLAKTGVNEITGVEIMDLLVEMNAIDKELWAAKVIWCQNLVNNVADVYKNRKREIPQKPIVTESNVITTNQKGINTSLDSKKGITTNESTQSKVKESTLKETTEDELPKQYREELKLEFPTIDIEEEYKKFTLWWAEGGKNLKRPKLAFRNWLNKAKEIRGEGKNAGVNRINSDDPEKFIKGKYGHMVQR